MIETFVAEMIENPALVSTNDNTEQINMGDGAIWKYVVL